VEESAQEPSAETVSNDTKTGASAKKNGNLNQLANERKQAATPYDKANVTPTPATAASKQKPNAKKSSAIPKKPDTAYLRYGKTTERIEKEREDRRLERKKNKLLKKKKK
ncbi:hypothetical protein JZO77_17985, partial [Enterococcus hulanensis]|uniref:hypothetical protein n=1 Tax=Enterococcus hulanensis TaxID=2559929 RepID=UPI001A8D5BAC